MTLGRMDLLMFAGWDIPALELPVDSWWFFTIVLVLLVLFIWAVTRLTTATTEDIDPAEIDRQMLTAVSELRSRGELTNEEFRSIKGRLVERLVTDTEEEESPREEDSDAPEPEETEAVEGTSEAVEPTATPPEESPTESESENPKNESDNQQPPA